MRLDWNLNIGTLLTIIGAMLLFLWRFHIHTVTRLESAIASLESMLRARTHDIADKFNELNLQTFKRVYELELRVARVEEHLRIKGEPE